ncbi:MAG: adaptor protein MecA [Coprococcus sp.]
MILLKIERLSENQIRCTLNKADLAEKELKISELAYGTAKAKELFKEMMQQASIELGFEVDDIPLMIEAIPVSPDCLILIVTKVEDPDELDTRFSRFSKVNEFDIESDDDENENEYYMADNDEFQQNASDSNQPIAPETIFDAIEGLVNTISGLATGKNNADGTTASTDETAANAIPAKTNEIFRVFVFDSINTIIKASKQIAGFYFSCNTLYKNPGSNKFYLLIRRDNNSAPEFSRVCSILSEYGTSIKTSYAMPYHFNEHYKIIIEEDAVQTLSAL